MAAWQDMEQKALDLALGVAGNANNIQYLYGGKWNPTPPPPPLPVGDGRDVIGSTHHESGTLWMGGPNDSVTDADGKFHHVSNAYVAGPALFPTAGSAHPSLTGMTLARKTARRLVRRAGQPPSAALEPLFTGRLTGSAMARAAS